FPNPKRRRDAFS
ncbi:3-octaprenyl-4-hydroxybenzoate carboxy-lyase family protein, partial [Chlamydia psittaci C1/97]